MTIGTREAAVILGRKEQRVRQLIAEGRLKAERVGRDWRIDPAAVAEYLRERGARQLEVAGGKT